VPLRLGVDPEQPRLAGYRLRLDLESELPAATFHFKRQRLEDHEGSRLGWCMGIVVPRRWVFADSHSRLHGPRYPRSKGLSSPVLIPNDFQQILVLHRSNHIVEFLGYLSALLVTRNEARRERQLSLPAGQVTPCRSRQVTDRDPTKEKSSILSPTTTPRTPHLQSNNGNLY
jgi:hypothetical protein